MEHRTDEEREQARLDEEHRDDERRDEEHRDDERRDEERFDAEGGDERGFGAERRFDAEGRDERGFDAEGRDEERAASHESRMATSSTAAAVAGDPDEQGTAPEDRDAAAAAEGRTTSGVMPATNVAGSDELYSGSDREGYRRRWDTLQAGFIDDPRAAAEQADALIGEVVDRLSQRRRELREELSHGGDRNGDTEAMRLTIRRYRALFLAVMRD